MAFFCEMSGIRHNLSWQTAHIARLSKAYNDVSAKTSNFATEYATKDHVTELIENSGFVTEEGVAELIASAKLESVIGDTYLTKNEAANTYATYDSVTNAIGPVSKSLNALDTSVSSMNAKFNDYATTAYVDQQIENGNFAQKDHIHNEYYLKVDTMLSVTLTHKENTYNEITVTADKSLLNTRVTLNCWNAFKDRVTDGFGAAIIDKNGNVSRNNAGTTYSDGSWYDDSTFTLCLKAVGRNPYDSIYTADNPIHSQEVIRLSEKLASEDHTHDNIYYTKTEIDSMISVLEATIQSLKNPA